MCPIGRASTAKENRVYTYRLELPVVLLRELVDEGSDHAARAAPGRPKVHEHGNVGLQDLGFERRVRDDGGGACLMENKGRDGQ